MTLEATAECRSCHRPIVFAKVGTCSGSWNPLDPDPRDDGNVVVIGHCPNGAPLVRVLSKEAAALPPGMFDERYVSHFATCPEAGQHRRARKRTPKGSG